MSQVVYQMAQILVPKLPKTRIKIFKYFQSLSPKETFTRKQIQDWELLAQKKRVLFFLTKFFQRNIIWKPENEMVGVFGKMPFCMVEIPLTMHNEKRAKIKGKIANSKEQKKEDEKPIFFAKMFSTIAT